MSVADKAKAIATLDSGAETALTKVLPLASIKLRNVMGETEYEAYQALDDTDQQKIDVEYAEAYYALYFLALSLKKLQENAVTPAKLGFDKGTITPSVVTELNKLRETYKAEAEDILSMYNTEVNGDAGIRMYAI